MLHAQAGVGTDGDLEGIAIKKETALVQGNGEMRWRHNAICLCARSQLTAEKRRLSPAKPLEIPSTLYVYYT
jgi:hypothetical protein